MGCYFQQFHIAAPEDCKSRIFQKISEAYSNDKSQFGYTQKFCKYFLWCFSILICKQTISTLAFETASFLNQILSLLSAFFKVTSSNITKFLYGKHLTLLLQPSNTNARITTFPPTFFSLSATRVLENHKITKYSTSHSLTFKSQSLSSKQPNQF